MKKDDNTVPEQVWWVGQENSDVPLIPKKSIIKYDSGSILIVIAFVLVFSGIILWTIFGSLSGSNQKNSQYGGIEHSASVDAVLNQCGNIFTFIPSEQHYGIIPDVPTATANLFEIPRHPMIIPVYGYMSDTGVPEGNVFSFPNIPPREEILKSMWDGKIVIWYTPDIEQSTMFAIREAAAEQGNTLIIEWPQTANQNYNDGQMPLDRKLAFSAWGVSQSCQTWDEGVFKEFANFVDTNSQYKPVGEIPFAPLDDEGRLRAIDVPR